MKQLFLILPLILSLSACQTMNHVGSSLGAGDIGPITTIPQGDCPGVSRVAELASLYQFATPTAPTPDQEISQAHITRVDVACGTSGGTLVLDLTLGVEGSVGPRGRNVPTEKPSFIYPYFVTLLDSSNKILFKDIHAVSLNYDAQLDQSRQIETVQARVPLESLNGAIPRNMRILVGFQLAPNEIAYNRTLPTDQLGKQVTPVNPASIAPLPQGMMPTTPPLPAAARVLTPAPAVAAPATTTPTAPNGTSRSTIEALKKGH